MILDIGNNKEKYFELIPYEEAMRKTELKDCPIFTGFGVLQISEKARTDEKLLKLLREELEKLVKDDDYF